MRLHVLDAPLRLDLDRAVRAGHTAFGLDSDEQAIVYAGTGR